MQPRLKFGVSKAIGKLKGLVDEKDDNQVWKLMGSWGPLVSSQKIL